VALAVLLVGAAFVVKLSVIIGKAPVGK
jgi:hypothetical protein